GAAPIHRSIMAGDTETGVCIMQMEEGLDTGPVLLRRATPIEAEETTGQLHDRLAGMGAMAAVDALADLDNLVPQPQANDGVTYAAKIDKTEARVDWTGTAVDIDRQIRGLSPVPGAWSIHNDQRIKWLGSRLVDGSGQPGDVLDDNLTVACGFGALRITRAQRAGRGVQEAGDFLRGNPITKGDRL
ncbi:MAG: methionyl-tRNA formyltransferase, partial [Pseudomonadota bacterium]